MSLFRQWLMVTLVMLLFVRPVTAEQDRNLRVSNTGSDQRIALVIGNGKYRASQLKNPVNDARAMANALRGFGFDVIERTDVTQKEMNRAITQFGQKLSSGGAGLFYYAGHGMQMRGKNFLVPVDAMIEGEQAVRSETVDLDLVMDQLANARVGMVILDACRNNPFERSFRGGQGGGLAQVDAPKGVLVAYATAPGKVAADGTGAHGLYTSELLRALNDPGRRIEDVFKQVRRNVANATNDQQIPWESSSLTGDFFFVAPVPGAVEGNVAAGTAPGEASDSNSIELEMWRSVKDSNIAADLQEYLKHYPQGKFAGLATARIDRLALLVSQSAGQARSLEAELAGKWKFGRAVGTLLAPAGHLCDVELLLTRGRYGNVIRACDSNESFWRVNGDSLEFVGSTGQITTVFAKNEQGYWQGAFLGMGGLFSGVIHYLKPDLAKRHDGIWSGELETYGGLFDVPVKVSLDVAVSNGQISGTVFMYGENRTVSGRVDPDGNLVEGKLRGSLQGYTLHGKLWAAEGEGVMGWKLHWRMAKKVMQ